MPRQPRLVVPLVAHHVTQRGNYGQVVFEGATDFARYCRWLNGVSNKHGLHVLAYCLMPNHVHFIVRPEHRDSLARVLGTVHTKYSQHANRKRDLRGHLWQARFFSCLLDDQHLYRAIRYVERNPVRAGLARLPWQYKWSSAPAHADAGPSPIALTSIYPDRVGMTWRDYVAADDPAILPDIRLTTSRGSVLAAEAFCREVEIRTGRPIISKNRGRPCKSSLADSAQRGHPPDCPPPSG